MFPRTELRANFSVLMVRSLTQNAPMGNPPPRPFAHEMASGSRLSTMALHAMSLPSLPKPTWTSSNMSRRSCLLQRVLSWVRNSAVAGLTPPSPWMGSRRMAQVWSEILAMTLSMSFSVA